MQSENKLGWWVVDDPAEYTGGCSTYRPQFDEAGADYQPFYETQEAAEAALSAMRASGCAGQLQILPFSILKIDMESVPLVEPKEFIARNIILVEWQDSPESTALCFGPDNKSPNRVFGKKIFRAIDVSSGNTLAQYDHQTNETDLRHLVNRIGHWFVFVSYLPGGAVDEFVWQKCVLGAMVANPAKLNKWLFAIQDLQVCPPEEQLFLDGLIPEFRSNCWKDPSIR